MAIASTDRRHIRELVWLALPVAVAGLDGCASMGTAAGDPRDAGGQAVGQPIPDLSLQGLEGYSSGAGVQLASFKGRVVLLDIWASWCAPCKEELPLLDDLAVRLKPKGVQVIAVSIDEEAANAADFLRGRPSWSLIVAHDPTAKVPSLLKPPKMPTSYVIDTAGIVRHINAGFERGDIDRLVASLTALTVEP